MSQFSDPGPADSPANPFASPPAAWQPPRRSRMWLWILLALGGLGVLGCCGCGGVIWFVMGKGFGILEQDVKNRLATDPTAQQHLGEVKTVKFDLLASIQTSEERGEEVFVFHVVGSKGQGDVIAKKPPPGSQSVYDAILVLPPDNRELDLSF